MKSFLRIAATLLLLALISAAVFYFNPLWVHDQQIRYRLWHSNVRSKTIAVDNHRLHYFEAVPPDGSPGVPLVLVHGLGARSEDWSPMIPGLAAAGFHVYVPDLLGYGRSSRPDLEYSVPHRRSRRRRLHAGRPPPARRRRRLVDGRMDRRQDRS